MLVVVVVVEVMVVEEGDEEEFSGVLRRAAMDRGWFVGAIATVLPPRCSPDTRYVN